MYLSILQVNVGADPDRPRPGRLWLRNMYHVHQRLCMAFPSRPRKHDDPQFLRPYRSTDFSETGAAENRADVHDERSCENGFLFRVDIRAGADPIIVVQSAKEPDWEYAFQNADYLIVPPWKRTPYNPAVAVGQLYEFRLKANTVRKTCQGPYAGKRVPVGRDRAALMDWLWRKGEKHGFEPVFEKDAEGWDTRWQVESGLLRAWRGHDDESREEMSFAFGLFNGVLRVTEPEKLIAGIQSGIGPAKAFGFGLLSVARMEK